MSDEPSEFPTKFGPALRLLFTSILLAPLVTGVFDSFKEGKLIQAALYAGAALIVFIVGVSWYQIGALAKRWARLVLSLLFVTSVAASAFALGTAVGRRQFPTPAAVGSIVWDFEQTASGNGYFLFMTRLNGQEIRVVGIQAHGKNVSDKAIEHFSGYARSEVTNVQTPIYLLAQEQEEPKANVCYAQTWIPTLPQETFGIPPFSDFQVSTFSKPVAVMEKDGIPLSKFMNDFVPFTVILEYDGTKYERRFSKEEVAKQVATFERSLKPQSLPHVTRKLDAKPPPPFPLQTLLPPDPPKAPLGLASPIPHEGLPPLSAQ